MINHTSWQKQELEDIKILIPRDQVNERLERMRNMLGRFIDPDQRIIDLKEMINAYNYPSEDIYWIMNNDY